MICPQVWDGTLGTLAHNPGEILIVTSLPGRWVGPLICVSPGVTGIGSHQ